MEMAARLIRCAAFFKATLMFTVFYRVKGGLLQRCLPSIAVDSLFRLSTVSRLIGQTEDKAFDFNYSNSIRFLLTTKVILPNSWYNISESRHNTLQHYNVS